MSMLSLKGRAELERNTQPRRSAIYVKPWKKARLTLRATNCQKEIINIPPLHLKLGLMKQFVKGLSVDGECFQYVVSFLPALSFKIKTRLFNRPQIQAIVRNREFVRKINGKEKSA
ncbi:hypothetical protein AVEN_219389-1 [Araneus ventricosus]|uniref:Uncharacterized protein n=1 Tax=Araneus ventricosus TaxID=182803 RepID=A0A4Y2BGQ2_ARAVE|nr:hypothetical protein AVEN_219389-1 [Araneus ventricosus]